MDARRRVLTLLAQDEWGEDQSEITAFRAWPLYPVFLELLSSLNVEALYKSRVHGSGHINRVLLLAALIARREDLEEPLLRDLLLACSYHDVGRTFDGLDLSHGSRSAERLEALTGRQGDALHTLQAAVAAHSQPDPLMEEYLAHYAPQDLARTRRLACLLKDADNLDRVRLGDLKPAFLRSESAKALCDFSVRLLARDQALKAQGAAASRP